MFNHKDVTQEYHIIVDGGQPRVLFTLPRYSSAAPYVQPYPPEALQR